MRLMRPMALATLLAQPLVAQQSPTPPDSVAADSVPTAGPHDWRLLPALAALGVVLAAAPPALFLVPNTTKPDSTRVLPDNYLAAYVTGGGIGENAPSSWTHSENLDLLRGHLYASLSIEHFQVREHLRYESIRAGYLFRPKRGFAGGLTLGYRRVSGRGGQDAAVIALPLMAGGREGAARFESAYVISREGVSWTYRLQAEAYLLPKPLFAGLVVEAKPLRQGAPYLGTVALLFGARR
jgi:hypothetical protein